ncbi:hypothetical protein BDV18DRAFT_145825 [Aspergillus unguis]
MRLSLFLLQQIIISLTLVLGRTNAQECARDNYTARNQSALDSISSNCTEISGEIGLVDWSGPLTLHNITRARSIRVYSGDVSSVDFPSLESLESDLLLTDLPSLRRVSLPRLEEAEGLYVDFVGERPQLDISRLKNASSLYLRGNLSEESFDALQYVDKKIDICNAVNCGYYSRMEVSTSMNLDFPVLERVGSFVVGGNVSRLSTPELSNITCKDCDWAALHLKLYGSSLIQVDFPKLAAMNGTIYVRGDIESISLPILRKYTNDFIAVPYEPLNITLPVEKADGFLFTGNVSSIQLPSLHSFSRIHIDSDLDFDCDKVWKGIDRTSGPLNESTKEEYFQCSVGVSLFDSSGLGFFETVGIAMVLGFGILGGLL